MAEIIERRSVERVPESERTTGFISLFLLWTGFVIAIGRLWVGGVIAGAGFWAALAAYALGHVLMVTVGIGAVMGASEGLPGTMIMRAAFGVRGGILPAVPMIIGTIGWFGVQLGMTASALDILIGSLYGGWGVPLKVQYVVWAALMGVISIYGYSVVLWFQKFVSPLLILLIPWMFFKMIANYDILSEISKAPQVPMGFWKAVTFVSGGGLAMVIGAADSSRYAKTRTTAFAGYMAANWTVGILIVYVGTLSAFLVGNADPASIVDKLGLGFLGLCIVVLSAWSTNCINPYWGGIALSTLSSGSRFSRKGLSRVTSTSIIVGLGAVSAVFGIYSVGGFMVFIRILAGTLAPANGIIIADYFFLRGKGKNRLDAAELTQNGGKYWYWKGWNPVAVAVWAVGIVYSYAVKELFWLVPPVSTQVVAGILYYVITRIVRERSA